MKQLLAKLRGYVEDQEAKLEVLGFGATATRPTYCEETVLPRDVNVVENRAHMMNASISRSSDRHRDIGGQDIKVLS